MSEIDSPVHSQAELDSAMRKIMALAEKTKAGANTTEAEASAATSVMQKLLTKYNLDIADIEARASNKTEVERVKEDLHGRAVYKWHQMLAKYVAEANFCYHEVRSRSQWVEGHYETPKIKRQAGVDTVMLEILRESSANARDDAQVWVPSKYKRINRHVFVGRTANVITTKLMFEYLAETIENACPDEYTSLR